MTGKLMDSDIPYLDEVLSRLVKEFGPQRVILFGSWVRGEANADSDIDILVITETNEPLNDRMARAHRALRGLTVPVDVFVCNSEEVERFSGWLSHTVSIALREGRELYAA